MDKVNYIRSFLNSKSSFGIIDDFQTTEKVVSEEHILLKVQNMLNKQKENLQQEFFGQIKELSEEYKSITTKIISRVDDTVFKMLKKQKYIESLLPSQKTLASLSNDKNSPKNKIMKNLSENEIINKKLIMNEITDVRKYYQKYDQSISNIKNEMNIMTEKMIQQEWNLSQKIGIMGVQLNELNKQNNKHTELQYEFNYRIEKNTGNVKIHSGRLDQFGLGLKKLNEGVFGMNKNLGHQVQEVKKKLSGKIEQSNKKLKGHTQQLDIILGNSKLNARKSSGSNKKTNNSQLCDKEFFLSDLVCNEYKSPGNSGKKSKRNV